MRDSAASRGGWKIPALNDRLGGSGRRLRGTGRRGGFDVSRILPIAGLLLAIVVLVLAVRGIVGCVGSMFVGGDGSAVSASDGSASGASGADSSSTDSAATASTASVTTASVVLDEGRTTASGEGRMSFSAVGDNLANENILELADSWAGETGDGEYDFAPFYTEISDYIQNNCDVSFVNQETTLGGTDEYDYMGYPSYNTPDSMAAAVAGAGWRIVSLDTNHTYDTWTASIEHAQQVWGGYSSQLVTVGSYASEADRQTVRLVECNGIRLAVLSYCYGQNGYEQSDLPNDYYAVPWDADAMREDVARARTVADVVVVYLHAGTEYTNEPNDEQRTAAQACADAGVDLMIGSHAHVIQPVEWVERSGGGEMLVAYGLGDFLSGYENRPATIMSGMLTCDFVRVSSDDGSGSGDAASEGSQDGAATIGSDEAGSGSASGGSAVNADHVGPGGIAIENVVWHPLVEHMEGNTDVVRFVKGYTDEEARANELLSSLDDPLAWLQDTTREVIGDTVTIDL